MSCPLFLTGACKVTMHQLTLMAVSDHRISKFVEQKWEARVVRDVSILHGWKLLLKIASSLFLGAFSFLSASKRLSYSTGTECAGMWVTQDPKDGI